MGWRVYVKNMNVNYSRPQFFYMFNYSHNNIDEMYKFNEEQNSKTYFVSNLKQLEPIQNITYP